MAPFGDLAPVWSFSSPAPVCFKWERQKRATGFLFRFGPLYMASVKSPSLPPPPAAPTLCAVQLQLQPANSLAILMAIVVVVVWTAQPAAIMVRCCCFYFFLLLLRFFVSFFRFSFSAIICLATSSSPPLALPLSLSLLLFLHLGQLSFPAVH